MLELGRSWDGYVHVGLYRSAGVYRDGTRDKHASYTILVGVYCPFRTIDLLTPSRLQENILVYLTELRLLATLHMVVE